MAENTSYIGVAMGLDVSDLKAGLSEANKQIQLANSEFKAASSGMDDWTKSTEGITAKIKQLDTVLKMQQAKLKGLTAEYEKIVEEQGEGSEAARKLKVQINNQQAVVNKTEKEFKNYKETLEQVEAGTLDLEEASLKGGKAVKKAGEQAEEAGDGFTVAKGAAADFIGNGLFAIVGAAKDAAKELLALSESTREYREDMGKLKTAWESAGKSTEQATKIYREFYSVLGEEDRSVEAVNHLAKFVETEQDMTKWTNIAAGVWGTFGDSLPIEGLTEASNETAKVGKVTGVLADALNWAGENEDAFNESLEQCNTEQERAQLITDTLNGLYEEAAGHYKENNASIIEARKETADYNDVLAEIGETLEPANAAINDFKLSLAKELAPVLKDDIVPAIDTFTDKLEDTGAAKKAGKALAFVVENLDDIAKVTVTAIGLWKTFKTVMAISNTISAASKAMKAYSTSVGVATKAQTAFNAAQKANLFGAIASLALTAVSAIATYALTAEDGKEATDLLTEAQRDAVNTADELAEEYRETKKAAAELAAAELSHINRAQNLWSELQKLVDENGKVKKGYKDRVNFILGELNTALGTEYTMTGDIIQQYADMKKSIEDVIIAKKANILLTAQEETYKKAVESVAAAEKARATQAQELVAQEAVVAEKRAYLKQMEASYASAADERTKAMYAQYVGSAQSALEKEEGILAEKQAAYNKTESVLYGYYSDINNYETASTLILQGETEKAVKYLDELSSGFKTVANTAQLEADEQKAVLEQQVIDTEINARLMKEAYANGVEGVTQEMVETAAEQAEKAKKEFHAVGGNITKGIAEGAESEEWTLTGAMEGLIKKGVEAARKAAIIRSPSKLFRDEVGKFIGAGVGVGVLASIPAVKKDVQKFNDFLAENIGVGGKVAALSADIEAGGETIQRSANPATVGSPVTNSRSTVVNAGMTINYNGNLSLKEIKQREREHYISVKTKLKAEGLI